MLQIGRDLLQSEGVPLFVGVKIMGPSELERILRFRLAEQAAQSLYRERRVVRAVDATHLQVGGRTYVNFASNDYLGLSHHPGVVGAMRTALAAGSAASPLMTGYGEEIAEAERKIADWKGTEAAVLLPSGYQAAQTIIQTFAALGRDQGIRILADKLCHASIIDAMIGSELPYRIFPHNGLEKLERLLTEAPPDQLQVVVTESIFSMDGDPADLQGVAALKAKRPFVLVLDEAHGSGVYGEKGAGYAVERGLGSIVDVSLVTLSKAAGLAGGAICASRGFCEAVANFGRAYIYSTAVTPALAKGIVGALQVMADEPGRQSRVRMLAQHVRATLGGKGFAIPAGDSPIIPVILGGEERALAAAEQLREAGLWVVAIRPPTVPRGGSRLRLTLSCEHTDEQVNRLIEELVKIAR